MKPLDEYSETLREEPPLELEEAATKLAAILSKEWPELRGDAREAVLAFYRKLRQENEIQNLTRLVSPRSFFEGHVEDVRALMQCGFLEYPVMDLGSGCGVPGLLMAAIEARPANAWFLVESERQKARFLSKLAEELGLGHVLVHAERGEEHLKKNRVRSVTARAVGPVDRIYSWLKTAPGWSSLILLKGPGWLGEWDKFCSGRNRNRLLLVNSFPYQTGADKKRRVIVKLQRN